ncbi:MAG: citrate lyase subunit alpha [Tissierellia bacterium]|nr:citrate lyase subunit alpha [Tissierellia bacterium]
MHFCDEIDFTKEPSFRSPDKTEKENKVLESLDQLFEVLQLKDGDTISFHHHLRNGDFVVNKVMEEIHKRNIKGLTLAISSIFPCHSPLVAYLEDGTILHVITSYMSGPVAEAISEGKLRGKLVMQSHGGRARAIMEDELAIDVAFIAAPASDRKGNLSAVDGNAFCGVLGYAVADSIKAKQVVAITDTLLDKESHTEIPQERVDWIVKIDAIGNPQGIISGTTRITKDPVGLSIANKAVEVMVATGLVKDGLCYQSGAGGVSLAVTKTLGEYMREHHIQGDFASGGVTGDLVEMLHEGLFQRIYDVQCFDLVSAESVKNDESHISMSAEKYASPYRDPCVNGLDFVILGATEVDLNFNVNVTTGHDGYIMGGSGGHQDTAYGAKVSIIVSKLHQSRIPLIVDRVGVITTPGSTVDILVTERGVAINPRRTDLMDALTNAGVEFMTIEELQEIQHGIIGKPSPKQRENKRVIGVSEYRDGQIIDRIYEV